MDKEEIKDYLKRADELELKLIGEDKDTYQWILFGYNQCAKLLNETEQQCKKQKEVIDKAIKLLKEKVKVISFDENGEGGGLELTDYDIQNLLDILKESGE